MEASEGAGPKRGRRAQRPDPGSGAAAAFACALLELKEAAGDPSYRSMREVHGAAASPSALSAAARGIHVPSWEVAWEYARSLAVEVLDRDEGEARSYWRQRWERARDAERRETAAARAGAPPEPAADAAAAVPAGTAGGQAPPPGPPTDAAPRSAAGASGGPAAARPLLHGVRGAAALVGAVLLGCALTLYAVQTFGGAPFGEQRAGAFTAPEDTPPLPGDESRLDADVTYPDGTEVAADSHFTKTWRLANTGSVPWRDRALQRLPPLGGVDTCATEERVPIPDTEPGTAVDISVEVRAPSEPTRCKVYWRMVDHQGRLFFPKNTGIFFDVSVVKKD
ncbi:NBR1-Ig-like domain-containing protein [Nocardiopsis coralliicola]